MLPFLFNRNFNFRRKSSKGRDNTGLHTASQKTAITLSQALTKKVEMLVKSL